MSSTAATRRASAASSTEQHPCLLFPLGSHDSAAAASTPSGVPSRMNTPTTSYPPRCSSAAATELSTPPLIATTTFPRDALMLINRQVYSHRPSTGPCQAHADKQCPTQSGDP